MKTLYYCFVVGVLLMQAARGQGTAATFTTLGYNSSGQVVGPTNLTFTNAFNIATNARALVRSNIGLGPTNQITFDQVDARKFFVSEATNGGIEFESAVVRNITLSNLGFGINGTNSFGADVIRANGVNGFKITAEVDDADIITFPNDSGPVVLNSVFWNYASVRTSLGATTLGSAIFTAANQTAARQALGLQSYTNTLTNSVGIVEIGSTNNTATVGWTIAPTNATYTLRTLVRGTNTNTITNNQSTLTFSNLGLTSDTTWTLTVGDGQGVTNTATTSVLFQNYMMWGRSTNTTLTNAALQSLHTSGGQASRAFATSRSRTFSMDGGGQYLYIAYPASFGSATAGGVTHAMFVDGNVFNNFVVTTNTYTNASGYTNSYLIYRTANIINGSGISFTVQ